LQYHLLPYSLKRGALIFNHIIEMILSGLANRCCLVYVKGIHIFGDSIEVMIANLDAVIVRISPEGASINLGKSKFLSEKTVFQGHTIGMSGPTATFMDISAVNEYMK
jgi:hypothetical protein